MIKGIVKPKIILKGMPRIMGYGIFKTKQIMDNTYLSIETKINIEKEVERKSISKTETGKEFKVYIDIEGQDEQKIKELGQELKKDGLQVKFHICSHHTKNLIPCQVEEL